MNFKIYSYLKKIIHTKIAVLCMLLVLTTAAKAQFYSFAKSTGAYTDITGGTTLVSGNWEDFAVLFKTPFVFKFFTLNINDSIELTDDFGIYFNNINNGLLEFFGTDLRSRGNNKSNVSYKTDGAAPNRILKMQFQNAGFNADEPVFADSINIQIWIYETSNILEFRYGPNSVKLASYDGELGAYVNIGDPLAVESNFITLEGNPASPTVRTANFASRNSLSGTPANGTIYRFTPSQFPTGIESVSESKINISQNKITLPANMEVSSIRIINMNGQVIQSGLSLENINLSGLTPGVYVVYINSKEGVITRKFVL